MKDEEYLRENKVLAISLTTSSVLIGTTSALCALTLPFDEHILDNPDLYNLSWSVLLLVSLIFSLVNFIWLIRSLYIARTAKKRNYRGQALGMIGLILSTFLLVPLLDIFTLSPVALIHFIPIVGGFLLWIDSNDRLKEMKNQETES